MKCAWYGLLLLLVGCSAARLRHPSPSLSASGDASWREVVPAGTTRYQLALGEVSSGGTPLQRVTPVYPPRVLARCPPPSEVSALLIIVRAGKVAEVRVTGKAQADVSRRAFIAAVARGCAAVAIQSAADQPLGR